MTCAHELFALLQHGEPALCKAPACACFPALHRLLPNTLNLVCPFHQTACACLLKRSWPTTTRDCCSGKSEGGKNSSAFPPLEHLFQPVWWYALQDKFYWKPTRIDLINILHQMYRVSLAASDLLALERRGLVSASSVACCFCQRSGHSPMLAARHSCHL